MSTHSKVCENEPMPPNYGNRDDLMSKGDTVALAEIATIKMTLNRILDHHDDFKAKLEKMDNKLSDTLQKANDEKTARIEAMQTIKDELHGRINTILVSILGGAGVFILGIVMWLVENKK